LRPPIFSRRLHSGTKGYIRIGYRSVTGRPS
jgi:hypothetical protein